MLKEIGTKLQEVVDSLNDKVFGVYGGDKYFTLDIEEDMDGYELCYRVNFSNRRIFSFIVNNNANQYYVKDFFEVSVSEEKIKNKVIEFFKAQIEENKKIIEALNSNEIDEILNAKNVQESIEKNAK